ncbi:MAG: class I SAM-dependent methyltransferase [Bacteroidales bacterium]
MEKGLESYLSEHSSAEDPLLNELYRFTYLNVVNPNMVSGHLQGKFLEFITYMMKPKLVLEIGTFTGYSAICIARALPEGGLLHTIEENDELKCVINRFLIKGGVAERIVLHIGRAQRIVPTLGLKFDMIFIDGDKREYADYYMLALDHLAPGGVILADNVLWGGKVREGESRDPQTRGIIEFNKMVKEDDSVVKVILPLRDGIMLIRRK